MQDLLDLFDLSPATATAEPPTPVMTDEVTNVDAALTASATMAGAKRRRDSGSGSGAKAVLEQAGELWGSEEYDEEYDLQSFLSRFRPG